MWYEDILGKRIGYYYNIIQNITLTSLNQLNTLSSSFSFEHPSSKHSSSSGNSLSNSPSSSNLAFFGTELWLFMLLAMVSHAMLWYSSLFLKRNCFSINRNMSLWQLPCVMLQKQFINHVHTCYIHVMYKSISYFNWDKLCSSCVILGYGKD